MKELKAQLEAAEKKHEQNQVDDKRAAIERERANAQKAREVVRCYESAVTGLQGLGGKVEPMGGRSHPLVSDVMVYDFGFISKLGRVNMSLEADEVIATCYPTEEEQRLRVDDKLPGALAVIVVSMLMRVADS